MTTFPYTAPVLKVLQPMGEFYVAVLPARLLLEVAESDVMSATLNPGGVGYTLSGTQRALKENRIGPIADYIDRVDAAFPNTIILAANHRKDTGFDEDEARFMTAEATGNLDASATQPSAEWTVTRDPNGEYRLTIPTPAKLAAIIDGQHRLFAFTRVENRQRLDMQLVCSIFIDLPKPFQAQLFATINSTQKQVDRSLTYELFGYNVSEETADYWTPDKLAVFLCRKLGTDPSSPLAGRIIVAPKKDESLEALAQENWKVSTAVVVDGIMRLISSNPKRDTNEMLSPPMPKTRSVLAQTTRDKSPMREAYLSVQDSVLYKMVENYLLACKSTFWNKAKPDSFILKTVGIQAQFDILRLLAAAAYEDKDLRVVSFEEKLAPAGNIDFAAVEFKNASGSGRSLIRRTIGQALQLL